MGENETQEQRHINSDKFLLLTLYIYFPKNNPIHIDSFEFNEKKKKEKEEKPCKTTLEWN